MYYSLFTHLPSEEHLGCFPVWALMNKTVINMQVFVWICFQLLWVNTKECNWWIMWWVCSLLLKKQPKCLPKWLSILHSHWRCMRVPVGPHPHQHSVLSVIQSLANSNRCVLVSHHCFNLHFLGGIWYEAFFRMLTSHLYIILGRCLLILWVWFCFDWPHIILY